MPQLNILYFYTKLNPGGGQKTSITLAIELKLRGHNIVYVAEKGALLESLIKEGVKYFHLPYNRFAPEDLEHISLTSILKLINLVKKEKIDLIHTYQDHPFVIAYIVSMACNIPIINTHVDRAEFFKPPWFRGTVICVSEEVKDAVASKYPIRPDNIVVLRNRIDLQRYHQGISTKELEIKYLLDPNDRKVVMMSRIVKEKHNAILYSLNAIINVADKIPNLKFILAGDGDYFNKIEREVKKVNKVIGREVVLMIGEIVDTATLLNLTDIVLGIGRCAWEGMACAKPTIIVGERGFAGIVDQTNVNTLGYYNFSGRNITEPVPFEVLSKAIISILNNKEYANSLSNFCQKFVTKEFDSKVGGERLEKIYYQVLENYKMNSPSKIVPFFSSCSIFLYIYLRVIAKKTILWTLDKILPNSWHFANRHKSD